MNDHEGYEVVPDYILNSLDNYAKERIPVGDFLKAMLSNDLFQAVGRADPSCMASMKMIVTYIHCQLPGCCWGSPQHYKDWLKGEQHA